MNDRKNRIDALKAATTEFRAALEALQNSSDPQEKAEAEATLKRAGWTKDDKGVFTPPSHPAKSDR
jgi:hypothetical protein